MDGSVNSNGTATFSASVSDIPLGGGFSLEPQSGVTENVEFEIAAGATPSMRLILPAMELNSNTTGFPGSGLDIPGITIDTSGTFDTGNIPLPDFSFDGIALSKPDGGALAKNNIRFRRTSGGNFKFDILAQIPFLNCSDHEFVINITNTAVGGSFSGTFCVLSSPASLEYSSGSSCQFTSDLDNYTIFFGSGCAGVSIRSSP